MQGVYEGFAKTNTQVGLAEIGDVFLSKSPLKIAQRASADGRIAGLVLSPDPA